MTIRFHRSFDKQFDGLSAAEKKKFEERIALFQSVPYHSFLNNHPLKGKYENCRSINIDGDVRAIYHLVDEETVLFIAVGKHSQLYE